MDVHILNYNSMLGNKKKNKNQPSGGGVSAVDGLRQAGGQVVLLCTELRRLPATLHQSVVQLLAVLHEPLVGPHHVQLHHGLCNATTP